MRKKEFDEMQQMLRYKIGYQSFLILAFMILAYVILTDFRIMKIENSTGLFILLLISLTYFISRCILSNALVGPKETTMKFTIKTFSLVLLSMTTAFLLIGFFSLKTSPSAPSGGGGQQLSLVCLIMWAVIGLVTLLKRYKDRKNDHKD
ncbi:MAG: hypothetical protein N2Z65_00610 [Clostridiales bacterium]|nr:hypothetical protein [Clostridiales bacterium]